MAKARNLLLNVIIQIKKGITEPRKLILECPTATLVHYVQRVYPAILVTPWSYNSKTRQLVRGSKWKIGLWCFWMFGIIHCRLMFILVQPILGNIPLQAIGQQKALVLQKQMDMMMYCIAAPFMLLLMFALWIVLLFMHEDVKLYNAASVTEKAAADKYMQFDSVEAFSRRYPYIKYGLFGIRFFPLLVGTLVGHLSYKYTESQIFAPAHFCSPSQPKLCRRFWAFVDFALGLYGSGLIVCMILTIVKCYMPVVTSLVYANERQLPVRAARKLYVELQVLMQHGNLHFRFFMAVALSLLLMGFVMINAAIPTMGSSARIPQGNTAIQSAIMIVSLVLTFLVYECLAKGELLESESIKFLKSLKARSCRNGEHNGTKQKRRRFKKLADRNPRLLRLSRMPLVAQIGLVYSIEHGAAMDFCQSVINHTFDAIVLFQ